MLSSLYCQCKRSQILSLRFRVLFFARAFSSRARNRKNHQQQLLLLLTHFQPVRAMPRLPQPATIEHDFVISTLTEHSLRVDGRQLLDARKLEVKFGNSYGSVEVILGGATRVLVQVSADIVKPRDERPFEGFVVLQTEIAPIAGSNHEAGGR